MMKLNKILLLLVFLLKSCQSVDVEESKPIPVALEPVEPEKTEVIEAPKFLELEKGNLYLKSFLEEPFKGEPLMPEIESGKYDGKLKSEKFNGKGILTWANNEVYKGDFKNGFMEGSGSFQKSFSFEQDSIKRNISIEGKVKANQFNGKTLYLVSSNEKDAPSVKSNFFKFEGEFKQNIPQNGKITFILKDNSEEIKISLSKEMNKSYMYKGEVEIKKDKSKISYKGEFNQDLIPNGKLLHTTPEETYDGIFLNGIRNGMGIVKRIDGSFDNGTWENGKFLKGKTKRQFGEGTYEGEFAGEAPEGKGKQSYPGGDYYEGLYKVGIYEGQGKLKEENKISSGIFKEGKLFKGTISEDGFIRYSVNNFETEDSPQYIAKVKREEAAELAREQREKAAAKARCNALINYVSSRFDCGSYCFQRSVYNNGLQASLMGYCVQYYCPHDIDVCSGFDY